MGAVVCAQLWMHCHWFALVSTATGVHKVRECRNSPVTQCSCYLATPKRLSNTHTLCCQVHLAATVTKRAAHPQCSDADNTHRRSSVNKGLWLVLVEDRAEPAKQRDAGARVHVQICVNACAAPSHTLDLLNHTSTHPTFAQRSLVMKAREQLPGQYRQNRTTMCIIHATSLTF